MMSLFACRPRALARCAAYAAAALLLQTPLFAQSGAGKAGPPSGSQAAPQPASHGQVIYSRSMDESGHTNTTTGPAAQLPAPAAEPVATDAEREAVAFTALDLDVHLHVADRKIAVRALVTVRNDGKTPLVHIPLQISSSLNWESIRIDGRDAPFPVATLNSDADHTGQLHEAAVTPAQPLAPGQSLQIVANYSGAIAANAQRLLAIGTPDDIAIHSDWDSIGVDFTGLRGFGNVVWYPVSSVPVILGDGARLFDEMGEHKLRLSGAHFSLRLSDEFPAGRPPAVAFINGYPVDLRLIEPPAASDETSGFATAEIHGSTLNFAAPSIFIAARAPHPAANATLWALPADEPAVAAWSDAAKTVSPFLEDWLGDRPRSQLAILDLPDPEDAPFETGALLATPIRPASSAQLNMVLVHALAHAWFQSPHAWLNEGVARFMSSLWLEKNDGRDKALESLETARQALALAEPASPGTSSGQPLAEAFSPVYYSTKAAYVLWMLRGLAGDSALAGALRASNSAAGSSGPGAFEKLLEQGEAKAGTGEKLGWFFSDWVDADKGLPDISIQKVFSEPAAAGNTLVGVTLANAGYAAAEVPVTVFTADTSVTRRVLVPARGSVIERITVVGKPTRVQANDGTVPEVEATVHVTDLTTQSAAGQSSGQPGAPQ
ncbi:MAG TPA: M1 family aminopeptidase [Terracidiphilus sp.]|nr:M1 family aminopeptidase [Terracidiphilus sp.]